MTKNPYDRRREYASWLVAARFTVPAAHRNLRAGDVVRVVATTTGLEGWRVQTEDGRTAWVNHNFLVVAN